RAMHAARQRAASDGGTRSASRAAATADPRVMACTRSATDSDSLSRCFDRLRHAPMADGGHLLASSSSFPEHNPAWDVPNWYINPSTGSDNNTCVDSAHPCKTGAHIVSLWGTDAPYLSVAVTITVLADWPANGDWLYFFPHLIQGGSLAIVGSEASTSCPALSSVVAQNRAAGIADARLHANLGACATPGAFLVNASRANSGAWVDTCVGAVCALSQPVAPNVPAFANGFPPPPENDAWANGD